jgi:hypothetical protein
LGPFRIFTKICEDIRYFVFIAGVNDTGDFNRFHDNDDYFFAANNDTGANLSPVSKTPAMKQLQQYQLA